MKKLKTILQYNHTYLILALIFLTYSLLITQLPTYKSKYSLNENNFICTLKDYSIDGDKLDLELKCKEKLLGTYYIKTENEKQDLEKKLKIGETININGMLTTPKKNTIPNLFNYKKFLYNKKIYYTLNIEKMNIDTNSINILDNIKNRIKSRINKIKHNEYVIAYILGNTDNINKEALESYRKNGISHLFALSGLHVSIFSMIIISLLKRVKLKEKFINIIVFLFLIFFSYISGFSPSMLRATLLSFLISINKIYNIKTENILYIILIIFIIINPYIIYNTSFILSFTTTYFIIIMSDFINSKNYIKGLLKVSLIAFISNIGISIYFFGYINPLSIIYNLFFVPLVSFIIFPITIIAFLFPFFSIVLNFLTTIMESISLFLTHVNSIIYFPKINVIELLIYYIFLLIFLKTKRKKYFLFILILLAYFKIYPLLISWTQVYFLDVGQGDSILLITPHTSKSILIDTGGKISYKTESWKERKNTYSIAESSLIPLMRSLGLNKIDYVILTHGDFDHMGEAINLVNNFKIEKVIFNCGDYNGLENELIQVLYAKNVDYYSCIKELNIDNNKLYFLNTKEYNNENDNSNVIYTEFSSIKFLFMGDAGTLTEKEILNKYNLPNIDVLKVGHHGSKTSSSEYFINKINPKYSIISVGKNNRYGHPNKEVLDNLKDSKIYRTDENGSILFKFKKDKLNIETFPP